MQLPSVIVKHALDAYLPTVLVDLVIEQFVTSYPKQVNKNDPRDVPHVRYREGKGEEWFGRRHGLWLIPRGPLPTPFSFEKADCDKIWYENGLKIREVLADGTKKYYKNNQLHRDNDLPAVDGPDIQEWYRHGKRHRDGGKPAIIKPGIKHWYINDQWIKSDPPQDWISYPGDRIISRVEINGTEMYNRHNLYSSIFEEFNRPSKMLGWSKLIGRHT